MADTASKPSREQLERAQELGREAASNAASIFSGNLDNTKILQQVGNKYNATIAKDDLANAAEKTALSKIHNECAIEGRGTANLDAFVQGIKDKAHELGIAHDKEDSSGYAITPKNVCHAVGVFKPIVR
jgi:hypothetical protein